VKYKPYNYILSLDIGGANTKISLLYIDYSKYIEESDEEEILKYKNILAKSEHLISKVEYFPFWQHKQDIFKDILWDIKKNIEKQIKEHYNKILKIKSDKEIKEESSKKISGQLEIGLNYFVVITITAELSDAFHTKYEGIKIICNCLESVFKSENTFLIDVNGKFLNIKESLGDYLSVSASNWVATSLVFGEGEKLGILLDMGSTTLDIIPIKDEKPVTIGKNDLDRLLNYELYYTGVLRPPISSIVKEVSFRNTICPISFEYFSNMADVYSILEKITEEQYTCETPDGRPKTKEYCYARLARILCADLDLVTKEELDEVAKYIARAHKELIKDAIYVAIENFIARFRIPLAMIRFNITGLGAYILEEALLELDVKPRQIYFKGLSDKEHILSTAICLGIVFIKEIIKEQVFQRKN